MNKIFFYKIYHANLAFSSIEYEEIPTVIDKCYTPLLEFVQKTETKIGIELSGYTLEQIKYFRPEWIKFFLKLHKKGLIELIGSGYMQIIAPLTPYKVNLYNQEVGLETYQKILGLRPKIAFVNEQVFATSLVDLYFEVGYEALVMEWNNAYSANRFQLLREDAYRPVYIQGIKHSLKLLWSDSLLFQQFQRVAHFEITHKEYMQTLQEYINKGYKTLPLYSSDLEIFNYRPGRFSTETTLTNDEWNNITNLVKKIKDFGSFILPSQVLKFTINKTLQLTNAKNPILVKKQKKYSLSRWAVCGRGSNYINTLCHQNLPHLNKKLLEYFGSDYKTHITYKKYTKAIKYLEKNRTLTQHSKPRNVKKISLILFQRFAIFSQNDFKLQFNLAKGATLHSIHYKEQEYNFGSVLHGEFEHIDYGADFYTGTTSIESSCFPKATNLHPTHIQAYAIENGIYVFSSTTPLNQFAKEKKRWILDTNTKKLTLQIKLYTTQFFPASIRLGTFTLKTQQRSDNLWYSIANGGKIAEKFSLKEQEISQHNPISLHVSSQSGLGISDGKISFGKEQTTLAEIQVDLAYSTPFVMLQHNQDQSNTLTRLHFSLQEIDDTLKEHTQREFKLQYSINLNL